MAARYGPAQGRTLRMWCSRSGSAGWPGRHGRPRRQIEQLIDAAPRLGALSARCTWASQGCCAGLQWDRAACRGRRWGRVHSAAGHRCPPGVRHQSPPRDGSTVRPCEIAEPALLVSPTSWPRVCGGSACSIHGKEAAPRSAMASIRVEL